MAGGGYKRTKEATAPKSTWVACIRGHALTLDSSFYREGAKSTDHYGFDLI